jgi:hypothetical protein
MAISILEALEADLGVASFLGVLSWSYAPDFKKARQLNF